MAAAVAKVDKSCPIMERLGHGQTEPCLETLRQQQMSPRMTNA